MTVWEIPVFCALSVLSGIKSVCALRERRGENCSLTHGFIEKRMYVLTAAWAVFYLILRVGFAMPIVPVRSVDLLCTYIMLAEVDRKQRIVPNSILLCYFTGQMLLGAMSMAPEELMWVAFTGLLFSAVIYLAVWFSKGKAGMGDARLLAVTAMTAGWRFTLQILVLAIGFSFLYSLWLLTVCKKNIRTEFPFVPFLALGLSVYMACLAFA